jgi:hypothetical protein
MASAASFICPIAECKNRVFSARFNNATKLGEHYRKKHGGIALTERIGSSLRAAGLSICEGCSLPFERLEGHWSRHPTCRTARSRRIARTTSQPLPSTSSSTSQLAQPAQWPSEAEEKVSLEDDCDAAAAEHVGDTDMDAKHSSAVSEESPEPCEAASSPSAAVAPAPAPARASSQASTALQVHSCFSQGCMARRNTSTMDEVL